MVVASGYGLYVYLVEYPQERCVAGDPVICYLNVVESQSDVKL